MTTAVKWRCDICHTEHHTEEAAQRCEKQPLPEQKFHKGDRFGENGEFMITSEHTTVRGWSNGAGMGHSRIYSVTGLAIWRSERNLESLGLYQEDGS